jgi:hypothetical protein
LISAVDGVGLACGAALIGALLSACGLSIAGLTCALASTLGIVGYAAAAAMTRAAARVAAESVLPPKASKEV